MKPDPVKDMWDTVKDSMRRFIQTTNNASFEDWVLIFPEEHRPRMRLMDCFWDSVKAEAV